MATGLKSRIAYKKPSSSPTAGAYWAGTYKLLMRAKSIPSPFGSPIMVNTSTLEDLVETQEIGRRAAGSMEVPGAFEKKYKDEMAKNEGKKFYYPLWNRRKRFGRNLRIYRSGNICTGRSDRRSSDRHCDRIRADRS